MKLAAYRKQGFIILSVLLAILSYVADPFHLDTNQKKVIAVAVLMITLWVTEAMPMPVVALLPLILFPLFKVGTIEATATAYANPVIFLFLGGFMLGLAIEKWQLHRRIALNIVRLTGTSGDRIILGFIISTGLISMWLSNTATAMMMYPIAMSVIAVLGEKNETDRSVRNFSLGLMLSIALAANIGGIGTIIGTPPNVAYAAFYTKQYESSVGFLQWMLLCVPIMIILLFTLYVVLVKWLYPNSMKADVNTTALIENEIHKLGATGKPEKRVLIIFICTALLWMTKDIINTFHLFKLDDNMIAVMAAVALFMTPAGTGSEKTLLDWEDTKKMAWGILLLFGGGIALAGALERAGLIQSLGQWFAQYGSSSLMLIFLVTLISLFISEVMSNVAQVIVFAPVVSGLADAVHMHPLQLGIPMTLAASCASMLPMGTPPNAIAFSSGHIKLSQMVRIGFVMNIIAVVMITLFSWLVLPLIFGTG